MSPLVFALRLAIAPAWAQPAPATAPPQQDPAELNARIAALEARLLELESERAGGPSAASAPSAATAPEAPAAPAAPVAPSGAAPPAPPAPPVAPLGASPPASIAPPAPPLTVVVPDSGRVNVNAGPGGVTVSADETRDELMSLGGPVDVYGVVEGDVVSMGGPIHVHEGGVVEGNAVAVGNDVRVDADGEIEGDAVSFGGRVNVDPEGEVQGDQVTVGTSAEAHAAVTVAESLSDEVEERSVAWQWFSDLVRRFSLGLAFAGAGVLMVGIWPGQVRNVGAVLPGNMLWYGLAGGILSAVLTLVATVFAITIIGIPFSLLIAAVLAAAWLLGLVSFCSAVGERLPVGQQKGAWAGFLAGAAVLLMVNLVPYLGALAIMLVGFPAVGATLMTRFGTRGEPA